MVSFLDPYKENLFSNPTDVTCQHSSYYVNGQKCQNFVTGIGAWTAGQADTNAFLIFNFPTGKKFGMVLMQMSRSNTFKCRVQKVTLSGGETLMVNIKNIVKLNTRCPEPIISGWYKCLHQKQCHIS